MIDIHAHILPAVDDGSFSLEESLRMLRMAEASGVWAVAATPHCNIPGSRSNYASEELMEQLISLRQAVKASGSDLVIYQGMEVYATRQMPQLLEEQKAWTLNGTQYFLTEFAFDEDPEFCRMILEDCFEAGFIPVIAHPERYFFVQKNPQIVYEWFCQGYGIQVNKGSLLGRFGRSTYDMAQLLMQHGLVTCVASDAHSSVQRTPHMHDVKQFLDKNYSEDYRSLVTEINPRRILSGQPLYRLDPIPFEGNGFR